MWLHPLIARKFFSVSRRLAAISDTIVCRLDDVGRANGSPEWFGKTETLDGERLLQALQQALGCTRIDPLEFTGQREKLPPGLSFVAFVVGVSHPTRDPGAVRLGHILQNIPFLVHGAALDGSLLTENICDGSPKGFRSIDHDEHRAIHAKSSFDELFQESFGNGGILRGSLAKCRGA